MFWTRLTQFDLLDRLGEEIVGSGVHRSFDVAQFVQGRDHQDHDPLGLRDPP